MRLIDRYQQAANEFCVAFDALEAARATVSEREYKRMRGYVDQARQNLAMAQAELERHLETHRCQAR